MARFFFLKNLTLCEISTAQRKQCRWKNCFQVIQYWQIVAIIKSCIELLMICRDISMYLLIS